MDRFFEEENVRRYRKLRDRGTTEAQRATILKQLSKELEHFRCEITEATSFPAGAPQAFARTWRAWLTSGKTT
jgi:hypothetical protein